MTCCIIYHDSVPLATNVYMRDVLEYPSNTVNISFEAFEVIFVTFDIINGAIHRYVCITVTWVTSHIWYVRFYCLLVTSNAGRFVYLALARAN